MTDAVNGIADLTDEEAGLKFLEKKAEGEEISAFLGEMKDDIMGRVNARGEKPDPKKDHLKLVAGSVEMMKEVRKTENVDNESAVRLLMDKGLKSDIQVSNLISIRKGVQPKDVPAKLLTDMEQYFDIETIKEVDRETLRKLRDTDKISEDEYNSCISTKTTEALKVKKI